VTSHRLPPAIVSSAALSWRAMAALTSGIAIYRSLGAQPMGGAVDTVLWGIEGSNLTILLTTTRSNTRSIVLTFIVINLRPELCPDVRVSAFER